MFNLVCSFKVETLDLNSHRSKSSWVTTVHFPVSFIILMRTVNIESINRKKLLDAYIEITIKVFEKKPETPCPKGIDAN